MAHLPESVQLSQSWPRVYHAGLATADRGARREAEARVLAAFNHPHIGSVYGIEEGGGVLAIVLDLETHL